MPGGSPGPTRPCSRARHGFPATERHGLRSGHDLGGEASASPALVRFSDSDGAVFARGADGSVQVEDSDRWELDTTGRPHSRAARGVRVGRWPDRPVRRGVDNAAYQRTLRMDIGVRGPRSAATSPTPRQSPSPHPLTGLCTLAAGMGRFGGGACPVGGPRSGRPQGSLYGRPVRFPERSPSGLRMTRSGSTAMVLWGSLGGSSVGARLCWRPRAGSTCSHARATTPCGSGNFIDGSWGGWFPREEFPSNAFDGSLGVAPGDNGSAWVTFRGVGGHVYRTVL